MEIVVTSTEMQACDRFAINQLHIPGLVLMELAGRGVVENMIKHLGPLTGKSILVVCGKGNNGGDGFVVARHLVNLGVNVTTALIGKSSMLKGDPKVNYKILKSIGKEFGKEENLRLIETQSMKKILPHDIIVDALFGTGFSGEVRGIYQQVIEWINGADSKKVAVDVPSGVNADDGSVGNVAVKADLTVTMGLRKIGLLVGQGRNCAGTVEIADIGIPENVFKQNSHSVKVIHRKDISEVLPKRPVDAHKHSVGKILVIAGSRGLTGAAALTAASAMKSGAGAVVLGTPASVYPILARKLTEVMVEPLPETQDGTLSVKALDQLADRLMWADTLIIGPGLSRNPETRTFIWDIIRTIKKPMLIDADGINAFEDNAILLERHKNRHVIITPHSGELARLIGVSSSEVESRRVSLAREAAKKFKLTIVLKGAPSVIADENGNMYLNSTGNSGMATAGAGDVLSGCIGSLWAQGMDRTPAAFAGVFIHGLAGDIAKQRFGEKSLMATDIQQFLPEAFLEIESTIAK